MSSNYDSSWIAVLISKVKGFTLKDRQDDYVRRFQAELRSRLRREIVVLESRWQKKEVYRIIIPLVFEFEFEYVLLSVYFDEEADYLLSELGTAFLSHRPLRYNDDYGLIRLLNSDDDFRGKVQRYLDALFLERMGLRAIRPKPGANEYPEINHIVTWILKELKNSEGAANVRFALLHFSKFWQMKYANPFNFQSAIIFLAKLEQNVRNLTLNEVKVDLSDSLELVGSTMAALIPQHLSSPVLNLYDLSTIKNTANYGYTNRILEFKKWCTVNALKFQDLSRRSTYELFNSYCNSQQDLKEIFLREIMMRFDRGDGLSDTEAKQFVQIKFSELSAEDRQLLNEIKRINYLFA